MTMVTTHPPSQTTLEDRYDMPEGYVLMSGTQVLARLPLEQRWRDQKAGLNTGGFIAGYRGSPLGGYDRELWRIEAKLKALNIQFQPAVNEDLAATAVWGTQYVNLYPGAKVDGVFGIWYGKSPGVDRSGDAFQHANTAGTAPTGGVIALVGDDHAAKSSSRAAQSDMQLRANGMPILYPSSTQEILDFGLHGIAMSRYSGCWISIKLVTDVLETTTSIEVGSSRAPVVLPPLPTLAPPGGLHIRTNEPPQEMEARLYEHKLPAALAYAQANNINRIFLSPATPKLGIVSAGKSWTDVRSALQVLGLDNAAAERAGIRLLKFGMSWPIDPLILAKFVEGLDQILVVEEKRPFLEEQIKAALQDNDAGAFVKVWGKVSPSNSARVPPGVSLLPLSGELTAQTIARTISGLIGLVDPTSSVALADETQAVAGLIRTPNFCSGCPHNSSTVVPDGSRTMAGIGCHGMAMWIRAESTSTVSHMGAEGMFWVGQSHFTDEKHVFVNIGDGTFFHSGSLAIRQAIAAKMRMTYKLLFNGYVAMTGGQKVDGDLTVQRAIDMVRAEGASKVVVVADDVDRYANIRLPDGVDVRPRSELDLVQRELREFGGVSILIYDQACATELRRQRKRNPALDVARRTVINAEVCEGCGDCGVKSNCMSVEPLETELGRKRQINQSTCNKDMSCVAGFCPSFVTVRGGRLKRLAVTPGGPQSWGELPLPTLPDTTGGYGILIAGIGGTGIVTVGAVLGMAASLDGLATSVLDVTGMAQKYGAVMSHLRFAPKGEALRSARLGKDEVDLLIGCDLIVASGDEALTKLRAGRSHAVVNTAINPTAEFPKQPDWAVNASGLIDRLRSKAVNGVRPLAASRIATALMGDAIAINMFMLGYAWQLSLVPVRFGAIDRAIELNGVQVEFNRSCFEWGRRMAIDPQAVERAAGVGGGRADSKVVEFTPRPMERVEDIAADRSRRLVDYQDKALADHYAEVVEKAQVADAKLTAKGYLAKAVARYYYKVLAEKDEFEVARLYSHPTFRAGLEAQFEGDYKLTLNLGGWPFAKRNLGTGEPEKREVGAWIFPAMKVLQAMRGLRDTWLDPFRNSLERALARELRANYEMDLQLIFDRAGNASATDAIALASLPERIRGYGHVRRAHANKMAGERDALRHRLATDQTEKRAA